MPDRSFKVTHRNGTATVDPVKVETRRGRGFRLLLRNLHATDGLDVSFDGGQTFYTIEAGGKLEEDIVFHFFWVRRNAAADVDYTALLFEG